MTRWATLDAVMTATVVELLRFLDDCAERRSVAPEEFSAETEFVGSQLASLDGAGRKRLLRLLGHMHREAADHSDAQRAAELAGLLPRARRHASPGGLRRAPAPLNLGSSYFGVVTQLAVSCSSA